MDVASCLDQKVFGGRRDYSFMKAERVPRCQRCFLACRQARGSWDSKNVTLGEHTVGKKRVFSNIHRPPKWELATFKGSTTFICTNPSSKPGLIPSLEDKRILKSRRNFFPHSVLALCHYLSSVLLKVHASSLCSNKTSIRDSKCIQCLGNDKFNNYSSPIKQSLNDNFKVWPRVSCFQTGTKNGTLRILCTALPRETQLGLR